MGEHKSNRHLKLVHSSDCPQVLSFPRKPELKLIKGGLKDLFYCTIDDAGVVKTHLFPPAGKKPSFKK